MRLIVADTGPINYLVLIGYIDLLPQLFEKIFMPVSVRDELAHVEAPSAVQEWIKGPPAWLEIRPVPSGQASDASLLSLDEGEREAIALAVSLNADLVLMDDREGTTVARQKGLAVTGTIGVLDLASRRGMVDLGEAFGRLKRTNFRYPQEIMNALLGQQRKPKL